MFKCLEELEKPEDTELLLMIDGDEELRKMVDYLLDVLVSKYKRIQVRDFGNSPASAIPERRIRISQIHNYAKQFISEDVDYVFLVEDDTNFAPDTLNQLLSTMKKYQPAFVQGVEVGRWKTPYIGGWKVDDLKEPTLVESVNVAEGIEDIDAGGLYCALVKQHLYFEHLFEPYDKKGKNGLACDFNFGLWLRNKGERVMIDWGVQCGHYKEGRQLRLEDVKPVKAIFEKTNDKWSSRGEYFND